MGSIKNAKRELVREAQSLVEKTKLKLDLIDDAKTILRLQAGNIAPMIKIKRDKGICLYKNKPHPYNKLIAHHIEEIDQFIDSFMEDFFEDQDIFKPKNGEKFLNEVEDYGKRVINHPHNLITVCHNCHTEIHMDVNSHISRLKRIAWKQTILWDNQKKIQDFFPENKKITTELLEVKEKLTRLNMDFVAKEKIIDILSTSNQNLKMNLDTLRDGYNILTEELKNYKHRLSEKENEPELIKKEIIALIKTTMVDPRLGEKRSKELKLEDLRKTAEGEKPVLTKISENIEQKTARLSIKEFSQNEINTLGRSSELIERTVQELLKASEDIWYIKIKNGYTYYLSKTEENSKFFGIRTVQEGIDWTPFRGSMKLGVLKLSSSSDKYIQKFGTKTIRSLEDIERNRVLIPLAYNLKRGVVENNKFIVTCTHCGALQPYKPLNKSIPLKPHRNCPFCGKEFYFTRESCVKIKLG